MDLLYTILIYVIVGLMGIFSFIFVWKSKNEEVFDFIIWFVVSLVGIFFFVSITSNEFIISFVLALALAFTGIKNG